MSISPSGPKDIVVIGAGIAGLTAAHTLKNAGYRVLILERSARAGGFIQSERHQDFLCETGPNTFLQSAKPLLSLASKLGIDSDLVQSAPEHNRRYLFKDGRLQELGMNPFKFLKSPLLSLRGKLRLFWEPFAKAPPEDKDESVADFVTRRVGAEILTTIVDPMVSGIIAGDTKQLSMAAAFPKVVAMERQHKSLFGAMRAMITKRKSKDAKNGKPKMGLLSFKDGMGTFSAALANSLKEDLWCDAHVEKVTRRADHQWEVQFGHHDGNFVQEAAAVIIAAPAYTAAALLSPILPDIVTPLSAIPYAPITVIHLGYRNSDITNMKPGFGFLIPRSEKVRLLGSIWSSQIYPNRAPKDHLLMTLMYGGATDPEITEISDNDLVKQVHDDLKTTMGIDARANFVNICRHGRAIPQYTIGHLSRIDNIRTILKTQPGLFVTGNYLTGYSVSDSIQNATHAATEIAEYLTARQTK